jgi:phage portal protein BeeE
MRGDTTARTQYYNAMHQNGILNADEIRSLEDFNDQPDGQGKLYFLNGNMLTRENAKQNLPKSAKQNGG